MAQTLILLDLQPPCHPLRFFPFLSQIQKGGIAFTFSCTDCGICHPVQPVRINCLETGENLWLAHEFQNHYDSKALTLNTEDHYIVGYCPRYLNSEIFEVLLRNPSFVEVRVEQVNQPPTPLQFRLLCNITAQCYDDFRPFSSDEYQPFIGEVVTV